MARAIPALLAVSAVLVAVPHPARGWGPKGHSMTGRVAARALPKDMPDFFRKSDIELGYLCGEPDRWRMPEREPELAGQWDRDHTAKIELMPDPMPPHRYDLLLAIIRKAKPGGGTYGLHDLGFAPYAIAEQSEMLTVSFMMWRKAAERSPEERRIKRQIEQNIIHVAGLLGHFVTDTGNPMHTSVHAHGWVAGYPNPTGWSGTDPHGRFEDQYVNAAIEEKDFASLVGPVRARSSGGWMDVAIGHIRESFSHIEELYALDKESPFGQGKETPAHKRFTCERLAHSAQALRDVWYSAWVRSEHLPEHKSLKLYVPATGSVSLFPSER